MNINSFFETIEKSINKNKLQSPSKIKINSINHNNIFTEIISIPFLYGKYLIKIPPQLDTKFIFNISDINNKNPISLEQIIFFDLETIGLSIGAGNYPFLIGALYIKKNKLHIKQYFIDNIGKLPFFLNKISNLLKKFNYIITYNGKTFDIHILKNQLLLNKLDKSFINNLIHIDLLHITRRIWKNELNKFSLGIIEEKIIKFIRQDDIPGYEISNHYFEFLRTGNWELIFPIIEHNKNDIISLFALLLMINDVKINSMFNIQQQYNILNFLYKKKRYQYAIAFYNEYNTLDYKILEIMALIYKKIKNHKKAEELWIKINNMNSLIELAKLYEFKIKDFYKALNYSQMALAKVNKIAENNYYFNKNFDYEIKQHILYRIKRLKHKIRKNKLDSKEKYINLKNTKE